jgi:hypothetical protein
MRVELQMVVLCRSVVGKKSLSFIESRFCREIEVHGTTEKEIELYWCESLKIPGKVKATLVANFNKTCSPPQMEQQD